MKIWILTTETPWFNPGGIARYVDNFSRYLAADGHEVTVFGADSEPGDREVVPGYRYIAVVPKWELCEQEVESKRPDDHPSFPYNILDYWGALSFQMAERVIEEIGRTGPPDVIESQEYTALPYYLLQRKLTEEGPLEHIPVVVNSHSPDFVCRQYDEDPRYQFPHYWTGRMEMFCLHAADSVICPSGYFTRQLEEMFGGSIKVNHYPLPWTDPKRFQGTSSTTSGKVLYFGRLEIRKGVLKLLAACDRLWREGEDFTLQMIGSDTSYFPRGMTVGEWIEKKYGKWIESGNLVIPGPMKFEELMQEVDEAAFTVIPSIWENWPNTCIESMSHGKVVVGSRHGGQAEMIGDDEACGFVFSWDNPGEFEQAFRKALSLDDAQRQQMGERGKERIAGLCEPGKVIRERLEHFRSILDTRPGRIFPFINRRLRNTSGKDNWLPGEEIENRVSVVIPYYNLGKYLGNAVDSALATKWHDLEIIIVDDGNEDTDSLEALEEIRKRNLPGVKIVRQENMGLAEARNTGAREATGELLLLLDADDMLEPDFINKSVHVLRKFDNVHVVYSWERYIEASDDIYPCWNFEFPYLLAHNMTCPISLLYRKSYLTYGPSKREMAYNFEDFELWISLMKNGCGGVALIDRLCNYRIREDSMWQGSNREQHIYLQDLIAHMHPDLFAEYGAELFCLQNANGSSQKWIKPSSSSPFDEYEQWSRKRIAYLEKESKRWWETSTELDQRLREAEKEKERLWKEKISLQQARDE